MRKGPLILGVVLIAAGALGLIASLTDIPVWAIIWPTFLILVGAWMILRPRMIPADRAIEQRVLGDIRRTGTWRVKPEELWMGVGDVRLDLSEAEIPEGQTLLTVYGFVGSLRVDVPQTIGLSVTTSALVSDGRFLKQRRERFLGTLVYESEGFADAERRVRIEATYLVVDVRVRQV